MVGLTRALRRADTAPAPDTALRWAEEFALDPARILVAVPALDEERHIETCLRSLIACPTMRQVRVVVADGGSTDRTRAIVAELGAEFPNLTLIDNPGRLQSAAVNRIAAECATPEHDVLVRCDAHAAYPPGYAVRVATSLLARGSAALATPMDATGRTCFQRAAAWVVDTPLGCGGAAHRGGRRSGLVDHGHHAGFRLAWFRHVGGYDESFSHNEDAELDHRITRAGGTIWLDADIRLEYRMRDSLAGLARQYWRYGRGRARTLLKHRLRPRLRQAIPVINLLGLAGCALLALLDPVFLLGPAGYVALLAGASLTFAARRRSLCGLWAGPAAGAMHLAWAAGFLWQAAVRGARR